MQIVPHVLNVYHIHIWAMNTIENTLTAHVVIDDLQAMETTKATMKHLLEEYNLPHSILEFEEKE